ncbi:LpqU family protein [Corynebacterium kutscheri]|uniref:LpqU family protein n=2 Tax=Corynebacterium kutscheri TaxID=35755 RepID=A0A0F6R2Q7_9CORY|nr:Transglycosylase SLT domain [Corynebacterium kutscheri]VEH09068.1 LpqU family protein [Corynebacterium kutscheri]VEH10119.1 LpqU family protein [Corynebacterium kutscheri]VEH80201.1 LpqU family protein [Corynebacterium kutscheri]
MILVISFVGWALSFMDGAAPIRTLQPIPDDVPPARGEEVSLIDINAAGRTSDALSAWAAPIAGDTNIPEAALRAYGNAELIAAQAWPHCHLSWTTLAGIGYVETRHGSYSGELINSRSINEDGYVLPPIIGVPLDGSPGFAHVSDTDGGNLDGDTVYDRAVGPMQFIPESWRRFGRDGNGDGVADPNQIDDAALSAAHLLCNGRDLATAEGWATAVYSYNMSNEYLYNVRDAAANYALRQPAV